MKRNDEDRELELGVRESYIYIYHLSNVNLVSRLLKMSFWDTRKRRERRASSQVHSFMTK